jgi:hypothetical protein
VVGEAGIVVARLGVAQEEKLPGGHDLHDD